MFLKKSVSYYFQVYALNLLIIIDIILLIYQMFFIRINSFAFNVIQIFDLIVCSILLIEFFINLYYSKDRADFFKKNWIFLIASIPFNFFIPPKFYSFGFLRFIRLFQILRIAVLFKMYILNFGRFLRKSSLDKILIIIFVTIFLFTFLIFYMDPNFTLFDSLWFVIVTITTVGYGDVVPDIYPARVISLFLIFFGFFIFSIITASLSTYFSDRLISGSVHNNDKILNELKDIKDELQKANEKNKSLENEISELKNLIGKD